MIQREFGDEYTIAWHDVKKYILVYPLWLVWAYPQEHISMCNGNGW